MKVLVVDDEKPARERLKHLLEELPDYEACGEAGNGVEALQMVQTRHPDIVLMDIRMPTMDGLEAAHYLAKLDAPPAVIFATAYDDHALEAFDAKATAYLLKPIRKEKLTNALARTKTLNRAQIANLDGDQESTSIRTHICAKLGNRLDLIPIGDVFYFQTDQKYATVRHRNGEVVIEESLKSLETELEPLFLRIHRNALVARAHLAGMEKTAEGRYQVVFKGIADRLEVSRRHVATARRLVKSH